MSWQDVVSKIAGTVPDLAGDLLTGDYVGMARTAVSAALGVSNNGDAVAKAIEADPSIVARLKQVDVDQYRGETERMKLELNDRESARQLQQTALEHGKGDFQNWLASGVLVGGFLLFALILFIPVDQMDSQVRTWAFPFIQAIITSVLGYYFGSTRWGNQNAVPRSGGGFMAQVATRSKRNG